jgi:hypothetical protein
MLTQNIDFTGSDGSAIVLNQALNAGDEVYVIAQAPFSVADTYDRAEADQTFASLSGASFTGNVGIGELVPSAKLSIADPVDRSLATGSGESQLRIQANGYTGFLALNATSFQIGQNSNSRSLTFHTGNGMPERMRIDSLGRVTTPNQPAFFARGVGTQSWSGTTNLQLPQFTSTTLNVGNHYNTSTYRFTAPVFGTYFFFFKIVDQTGTTGPAINFHINGVNQGEEGISYYTAFSTTTTIVLRTVNANDIIDFRVQNYNNTTFTMDLFRSGFGGYLIG